MENLLDVNNDDYVVIDLDSGTVVGTNLVAVPWPKDEELQEEILSSDSAAYRYAHDFGKAIFILQNLEEYETDNEGQIIIYTGIYPNGKSE